MSKHGLNLDSLGEKHKNLEKVFASQRLIPGVPVIARLDGRAFHTLLKGAVKPFDDTVVNAMQQTAKELLDNFDADLAYTQSDEITMIWKDLSMFDCKVQKMVSTLASLASVTFSFGYKKRGTFDCRIWQVPSLDLAAENVMWRELDATKNSVSMLASAHFSDKELHGMHTNERLLMLEGKGIIWGNLPHWLKKGSYYQKQSRFFKLTDEEMSGIPEKFRPVGEVLRSVIINLNIPPAAKISNLKEVLFEEAEPIEYKGEKEDVAI